MEVVPGAFRRTRCRGQGGLEPSMQIGGMVRDDVHDDSDSDVVGGSHHDVEVSQSAQSWIHVTVVVDIVSAVGQR